MDPPVGQQCVDVAVADAGDVRLDRLVAGDRQGALEVGDGAEVAEVMLAAEIGVRVVAEQAEQEGLLDGGRVAPSARRPAPSPSEVLAP